jgi:serralysin
MRPSPARPVPLLLALCACGGTPARKSTDSAAGDSAAPACTAPRPLRLDGCRVQLLDDANGDGRFPDERTELYDAEGRLESWDWRSPNEPDRYSACRRTYPAEGLTEEACWGSPAYRYTWTFADGRPTGRVYDAGQDGVVDKVWTYELDGDGRIVAELVDEDLDGAADARVDYTLDADGNRLSEAWDYTLDGAVDARTTTTWADGRRTREERDTDGDGTVDGVTTWTYDAFGQPLEEAVDDGADGDAEATTTWVYEDCRLSEKVAVDGDARAVTAYTLDALDRVVEERVDYNLDGAADRVAWTTWDCPGG